jgi:hypothetical protein
MVLHIEMTKKYISILLKFIFAILKLIILVNQNNWKNLIFLYIFSQILLLIILRWKH